MGGKRSIRHCNGANEFEEADTLPLKHLVDLYEVLDVHKRGDVLPGDALVARYGNMAHL